MSVSMWRRPAVSTMRTSRPDAHRFGQALFGHHHRTGVLGENGYADLTAEDAQLLNGGGPLQVGRH